MRWDDRIFLGKYGEWEWFVCRNPIWRLLGPVLTEHAGARLWICTFDSGTISPNPEEAQAGWTTVDGIMVSPPLTEGLEVPCDQHDEWYVFEDARSRISGLERFVNYGGFNLANPADMEASFDPSWDRGALDFLYLLQRRFWSQMESLRPISYIGRGDNDVVVTRNPDFARRIHGQLMSAEQIAAGDVRRRTRLSNGVGL